MTFDSIINDLTLAVTSHPILLPLAVAVIACAESLAFIGIIVPAAALLFALTAVAGTAQAGLWELILAGAVGSFVGDAISFFTGRYAKPYLQNHRPLKNHPQWLERGDSFFASYGWLSIFIGRFVGPLRPLIPFVAGSCGMRPLLFLPLAVIGGIGWALAYLLPGYLTGHSASWIEAAEPADIIAIASVISILVLFQQVHLRLHPERSLTLWLAAKGYDPHRLSALCFTLAAVTLLILLTALQLSGITAHANPLIFEQLQVSDPQARQFIWFISNMGEPVMTFVVAWILALVGFALTRRFDCLVFPLVLMFTQLLNIILKHIFTVARPPHGQELLASFSFPSGHATSAAVFFGTFTVWLLHGQRHHVRHIGYLLAAVPIIAIALSRPMLGVHWPMDIAAGLCEGLMACGLFRLWLHNRSGRTLPLLPILALLAVMLIGYSSYRLFITGQA